MLALGCAGLVKIADRLARDLEFSVGETGLAALHRASEALSQLRPPADSIGPHDSHDATPSTRHNGGHRRRDGPKRHGGVLDLCPGVCSPASPQGFETWKAFADALDMSAEDRERYTAIIDPKGVGPRIVFQKVPEARLPRTGGTSTSTSSTGPCPKTSTTKSGRPG